MFKGILNEIGIIIAILDKSSLKPVFMSDIFKGLVGSTSEDILSFLQSKGCRLTKEKMLDQSSYLPIKFVAEIKKKRARQVIDFKVSCDPLGNILIHGEDITNAKKLEYLLKSYSTILEKQQKLYKMAYTDSLTNAPNRRAFYEHYSKNVSQHSDTMNSVCILDIDHFKQVNDNHGHAFGDYVLKYFSSHIAAELDDQCFFARLGGEEFCVFSKNRTSEQLANLVERVLKTLKSKTIITPNKETLKISFSAGVAEYKKDGITLSELLNNADKALYIAKEVGRSCVISFSCDLSSEVHV